MPTSGYLAAQGIGRRHRAGRLRHWIRRAGPTQTHSMDHLKIDRGFVSGLVPAGDESGPHPGVDGSWSRPLPRWRRVSAWVWLQRASEHGAG